MLSWSLATAAGGEVATRAREYDLEARFDPGEARLEASVVVRFDGPGCPEDLPFYLHGELRVSAMRASGENVPFEQEPVLYSYDYSMVATRVRWGCPAGGLEDGLEIHYQGHFNPSRARSISDYMRIDADGVFLRSYGYSLWFPVFLEAGRDSHAVSFSRVVVRGPADFVTVFAGARLRHEVVGSERVSEWTAPHLDLFDAQLTAGRLTEKRRGRVWLFHRREPASAAAAERMASLTDELVAFFERHYRSSAAAGGPVHLVEMPRFGNIASGNVVGVASGEWQELDPGGATGRLLAHELVHAFVQPTTARSDPAHALIIEGFPSYFHLPALAERLGEAWYRAYLDSIEDRYLARRRNGADRRGDPLPPEKPLLLITANEIGTYKDRFVLADRALLFLDAVRERLGPEPFLRFAKRLLDRESLSEADLRGALLEELPEFGEDLRRWLETTEYPARWHRPRVAAP